MDAPQAWGDYVSPLTERIDTIRDTIVANAERRGWTMDPDQLDDSTSFVAWCSSAASTAWTRPDGGGAGQGLAVAAHLHGGAPLSFLDHHLRLWRQPVRRLGAARHRQGRTTGWPVPEGLAQPGHPRGGTHADHRGTDGRGGCGGASLRRGVCQGPGNDGAVECAAVASSRLRLDGPSRPRGQGRIPRLAGTGRSAIQFTLLRVATRLWQKRKWRCASHAFSGGLGNSSRTNVS